MVASVTLVTDVANIRYWPGALSTMPPENFDAIDRIVGSLMTCKLDPP